MADYASKYSVAFKAIPHVKRTLAVAQESDRFYRAENLRERDAVVAVGTANYLAGGVATTTGVWLGAKSGAGAGAYVGSIFGPGGAAVGAIIGGTGGGIVGAWTASQAYDAKVAPEVRARLIGEKFRK